MKRLLASFVFSALLAISIACGGTKTEEKPDGTSDAGAQQLPIEITKVSSVIDDNFQAIAAGLAQNGIFINEAFQDLSCDCKGQVTCDCGAEQQTIETKPRDLANWLKDHLFNKDHFAAEQSTTTSALFCLNPKDACPVNSSTGVIDEKCNSVLSNEPVCIRVVSYVEGELDLALIVGKQQLNPANLHVKPSSVSLEANLADLRSSLVTLVAASGETLPEQFPTQMSGKVAVSLVQKTEKVIELAVGVVDPVEIQLYPTAHERHSEVRIAASSKLISLTADANNKQLVAQFALENVQLILAADSLLPQETCTESGCTPKHYFGQFLLNLAGARFTTTLTSSAAGETLTFKNVSLGNETSTLKFVNGSQVSELVKADLNSSLGRALDITFEKGTDGIKLDLSPGFDLRIEHDLRALASQLPDLKGAQLKAISEVKLIGQGSSVFFPKDGGRIEIKGGTLNLDATGMLDLPEIHIAASAGQCVVEVGELADGAHPFSNLAPASCAN